MHCQKFRTKRASALVVNRQTRTELCLDALEKMISRRQSMLANKRHQLLRRY
jgi:hypothetical protein